MPDQGLRELYIDELKDLYNAENQLVKALPKMAKTANSDELKHSHISGGTAAGKIALPSIFVPEK